MEITYKIYPLDDASLKEVRNLDLASKFALASQFHCDAIRMSRRQDTLLRKHFGHHANKDLTVNGVKLVACDA